MTVAKALSVTSDCPSGVVLTLIVLETTESEKFRGVLVAVIVKVHVQDALGKSSLTPPHGGEIGLPFLSVVTGNSPLLAWTVSWSVIKILVNLISLAVRMIVKVISWGRLLLFSILVGLAVLVIVKY